MSNADVARSWREHDYDIREYLERNWSRIGPDLAGKIHLYCGDMDNYYLNLAVYLLEDFLKGTKDPAYGGTVQYGRPLKGHGWQPMSDADLVREMAAEDAARADEMQARNETLGPLHGLPVAHKDLMEASVSCSAVSRTRRRGPFAGASTCPSRCRWDLHWRRSSGTRPCHSRRATYSCSCSTPSRSDR